MRHAFVLIENPSKSSNWGPLLRCCAAFGIPIIVAVGFEKCAVQGSHGASKHVQIVAFPNHDQALAFLRKELECITICGILGGCGSDVYGSPDGDGHSVRRDASTNMIYVDANEESDDGDTNNENSTQRQQQQRARCTSASEFKDVASYPKSHPVTNRRFAIQKGIGNVCFAVGKKSKGLPDSLARLCDVFCHVPHQFSGAHDHGVEYSMLNTETCFSIVLHHFMLQSGNVTDGTSNFQGQKYDVAKVIKGAFGDAKRAEVERQERLEQKRELEAMAQDAIDDGCIGNLLGDGDANDGGAAGDY
uniref:tRNA/rRNA methyltransferase SpoU type domain-containing protein n=1 Tax=Craspedostauros australis TaxID=1486917 RepID=A0A7R9ZKU3_9STRA|mmetsp:Transcript_12501/g.34439  ORF Transcript_12501/g.34439 Transcript_12501/m.34439 type:complete len:304 (+) Transcript_12501:106-1017(+)